MISKEQRSAHLWALSTMPKLTAPADSAGELQRYRLPIACNLIASVTLYEMYHPGPAGRLAGMVDAFATTLDVDEHLSWIKEMVEAPVDDDEPTAVMWLRTFARMPRTERWPIAWMIRASMPTVGYQPEAAS